MNKKDKDLIPVQALLIPKSIIYTGKILNWISPFLASRFAARLFLTPFGYKMPEREKKMFAEAHKEKVYIDKIRRSVVVYTYGTAEKKILLSHGWSGSGTQLSKRTIMPHFIETIHHLEKSHGPFEAAIGHSLGGMSLLRATKNGLSIKKLVIIGTANSITAITKNFAKNLQLNNKVGQLLKSYFDKRFGENLDNYSGATSAKEVKIPTLVIHDKNDVDVHYSAAHEIIKELENGQLILTEQLGHRKILGDKKVLVQILNFILE